MNDASATSPYRTTEPSVTEREGATDSHSSVPPCAECESFIDSRCPTCGCCSHDWIEPVCPCEAKGCGCRENREWDEAEAARNNQSAQEAS